ncbi:uncharacterized protein LOC108621964 [Ceratina calcarata]|uniref:Uncharacterized protein LOC108621964 n=1 Tax=Ceratina calcarata TaxID=156304 RepID=A0AAJ7N2X9_9HYME|nr:uncharacterized protein LOC108621964 [Ceratina calcarata]
MLNDTRLPIHGFVNVPVMRVLNYLCLVLLNQVTNYGGYAKRVHLRIVVPDVINHRVHTRTVLLHLHVPVPKKPPPKNHHKHEYHTNWSSWRYGRYHDYEHEGEPELDHEDHHMDEKEKPKRRQKYFPVTDYHRGSYSPSYVDDNDNNVEEKERDSYAVHEDVNDIPPNTETMSYNYEEGYKKGLETESGHLKSDQMHKFHEDLREEEGDAEGGGFKEDFRMKTDAGRYIVDDAEYENTRDKRERARSKT